jgi:putative lipoic acid-binding regulatory protein
MSDHDALKGAVGLPAAAVDAEPDAPAADQVMPNGKDLASDNGKEEIFKFPCDFPIKVMGKTAPEFPETVMSLVETLAPDFDRTRVETRASGGGNYTGLTVTINAQSRAQLDDIYRALTSHPAIKYVL